jgi:hypothetical protein
MLRPLQWCKPLLLRLLQLASGSARAAWGGERCCWHYSRRHKQPAPQLASAAHSLQKWSRLDQWGETRGSRHADERMLLWGATNSIHARCPCQTNTTCWYLLAATCCSVAQPTAQPKLGHVSKQLAHACRRQGERCHDAAAGAWHACCPLHHPPEETDSLQQPCMWRLTKQGAVCCASFPAHTEMNRCPKQHLLGG